MFWQNISAKQAPDTKHHWHKELKLELISEDN